MTTTETTQERVEMKRKAQNWDEFVAFVQGFGLAFFLLLLAGWWTAW
jgi:hypothetical protein